MNLCYHIQTLAPCLSLSFCRFKWPLVHHFCLLVSGHPLTIVFNPLMKCPDPPAASPEVHTLASDQLISPEATTSSSANTPHNRGLKGKGSVFWSSSPKSVNSISVISKVRQKTPSIHCMWTHSQSVQNGLEWPDPPVSVMEAGETTKEDDDDDDEAESEPEVMTQAFCSMMEHCQ